MHSENMHTATSYLYCACVAHNRRIAHAACTLDGIVCLVFRSCSWSNGLDIVLELGINVRAWDREWVFHAFIFSLS